MTKIGRLRAAPAVLTEDFPLLRWILNDSEPDGLGIVVEVRLHVLKQTYVKNSRKYGK
ncbi:hypothetical protein [Halobaculum roseum]|uniref:Uncharacterized protein n=1 Tax=Halobaculum roseum TaxID=2175149 RepID=A0ABD5MMG0_9EURY|nr:hypothetical protein [Halobaculum roseum]QZY04213.1 hypothetical protein K6T36_15985 [Halobaculum roseum]